MANNWKRISERQDLARVPDHAALKKACNAAKEQINKNYGTSPQRQMPAEWGHLETVVGTFIQMQQHRHTADYDNSKKWTRTETQQKIDAVTAAFESWKVVRNEDIAQKLLFSFLTTRR